MGATGQPNRKAVFAIVVGLIALSGVFSAHHVAKAEDRVSAQRLTDLERRADQLSRRMADLQSRVRALAGAIAPDYELPPSLRTDEPRERRPSQPQRDVTANPLATLYFRAGSSQLGAPERAAIARLAADRARSRRPITLIAHADEDGSPRYNWQISVQRARRVSEAMVTAGFDPSALVVWACGRNRPAAQCSGNTQCAPDNRRVAVVDGAIEAGLEGCERTMPAAS